MSHKRGGTGIIPGFSYSGFVLPKNDSPHAGAAIPPPTVGFKSTGTGLSKQGYSTMMAISQNALSCQTNWGAPKKRAKTEDEYFDEEEEFTNQNNTLEYIPGKLKIFFKIGFKIYVMQICIYVILFFFFCF